MTASKGPEPRWLSTPMVRAMHGDLMRQHGGSLELRDEYLLASALARPRNRWHYEHDTDLVENAAAYGFGLVRNNPFVDGNKPVAFQAMYVFLGLNGRRIVAEGAGVVGLMAAAAAGELDEAELAYWLREHVEPR